LTDEDLNQHQPEDEPHSAPVLGEEAEPGQPLGEDVVTPGESEPETDDLDEGDAKQDDGLDESADYERPRRSRMNLILTAVALVVLVGTIAVGYFIFQATKLQDVPQTLADVNILNIQQAIAANPKQVGLYLDLAGAYYDIGRYDAALKALDTLESSSPKPDAKVLALSVFGRGKIAEKRGDKGTALREYVRSLEITETPDARYALGALYMQRKQYKEAITELERYVVLQPGEGDGLILLAKAYEGAGDPKSALTTYETARTFLTDDPEVNAAIKRLKGQQ
jgi:tetratricopeptide (TPR) repeat protein